MDARGNGMWVGNKEVTRIYLGNTKIPYVYNGSNLAYEDIETPFYTKALGSGQISWCLPSYVSSSTQTMSSVSYKKEGDTNWTTSSLTSSNQLITVTGLTKGQKVFWKGSGLRTASATTNTNAARFSRFSASTNYEVGGYILSLLSGDTESNYKSTATTSTYAFRMLFSGSTTLKSAKNLILPKTLGTNACRMMFRGCTGLTDGPILPAETLTNNCYYDMFDGCTSLSSITAYFTTTPSTTYTSAWTTSVSSSGVFYRPSNATWSLDGANGKPTNWTFKEYSRSFF